MDVSKDNRQALRPVTLLLGLLALLSGIGSTAVYADDWVSITSFREVRQMRSFGDTLYAATSGGLLVTDDIASTGRRYTNLDGLGTADITALIRDADGQIWVTGYGRLIRFAGAVSVRYPFVDRTRSMISLYCLVDDGNLLWLGTGLGLVTFSKSIDDGLILDTYEEMGDLNSSPEVYALELMGDSLWVATGAGLALASRANRQELYSPNAWRTWSRATHGELVSDTMTAVRVHVGTVYVGSARGAYRLDRAADTLIALPGLATARVYDMAVERDTLFVYASTGLYAVSGFSATRLTIAGLPSAPVAGALVGGVRWFGVATGGVYAVENGAAVEYAHTGLPGNDILDAAAGCEGRLLALPFKGGLYERDATGEWQVLPVVTSEHSVDLRCDPSGQPWVGTWGSGLSVVSDSGIARYTQTNSTLRGVSEGPWYIVVSGLAFSDTHAFAAVYRGIEGVRVAVARLGALDDLSSWGVVGQSDGVSDDRIIAVDYYDGQLAIGSERDGLYWCTLASDPVADGATSVRHFTSGFASIPSDVVRCVHFGPEGDLWVGTNFGVSRYDQGIERFVEISPQAGFGPDILAIEHDSRGNVWLGAVNGLARIDALTGQFTVYTSRTSGLLDDAVVGISFDSVSGDLYAATAKGISVFKSPYGPPTSNFDSVYAFPNPFVIDDTDDELNFNYAGQADLRIFTVAGELVYHSSELVWNGRNQFGEPVASGVYLFVLSDDAGDVGRGKILLVRN